MSSSSLANDEVIRRAALETLEALPYRLKHEVEGFLHGVVVGRAQQLEAYADELFQAFEGVRKLVRSRHGDRITLHRGEPAQKPDIARRFLSWSPSRKMSLEFAGQEGHELLTAEVDVDDVVAVLAASHSKRYIEYLVRDRKSYHTSGRRPPLLCRVDFDIPWDGFSHELIDGMKRRLERELTAVNGRILSMHVDEENGQADAHVLVPANVHTRVDDDMIRLGEFELYSPRPYVRGLEESSERRRSRQHGETTMRIRLGELRGIIRETANELGIDVLKVELEKIASSRKPFLHGKWQRDHRHAGMVDYYTAQDENGRTFTLQIDSDTLYKNDGRLRVPAKTKFFWKASIVLDPGAPWKNVTFFHASATGEGTERPKRDAFRAKALKIFGFDPFTWAGPL